MLTSSTSPVFIALKEFLKGKFRLLELVPHGSSSFHKTYKAITSEGEYFVKANSLSGTEGMFVAEAKGLALLRSTKSIGVPVVIECGSLSGFNFLVLEFILTGKRISEYQERFGEQLAQLHMHRSGEFGLDHHNYIGTIPQQNTPSVSGANFMITQRYEPLLKRGAQKGVVPISLQRKFELLFNKLEHLLPQEPASLIHGDLWNGNCIAGSDGKAWLIDSAVYYGYRESDLAMMKLFGGFDASCYLAYLNVYEPEAGWKERISLFQIYPLLVHLNLFGTGYLPGLRDAINEYL